MYKKNNKCRICGNTKLVSVIDLGKLSLTGLFPKAGSKFVSPGPLELVKCHSGAGKSCGLLQLKHTYEPDEMYGANYGYRSGLNRSMVSHLRDTVEKLVKTVSLAKGDLVLDIGSNDGTLLKSYPAGRYVCAGIDPTGKKFKKYYPAHIKLIPDFFSSALFRNNFKDKKAKIVTSIAMFYDLSSPMSFMKQVHEILADDGVWFFEQSYMPTMLKVNAYDTICHEHLEYYGLKQIKWMADRTGFKIIDVQLNEVNGGSFSVLMAKAGSGLKENKSRISLLLEKERKLGLDTLAPYKAFKARMFAHRKKLIALVRRLGARKKTVFGYGASTKGNVILQFCGFNSADIPYIAEVNEDKYGCLTPGSLIPIISEEKARAMKPDYFLVLPWHFRGNIIEREKGFVGAGGKLIFPLPALSVYP